MSDTPSPITPEEAHAAFIEPRPNILGHIFAKIDACLAKGEREILLRDELGGGPGREGLVEAIILRYREAEWGCKRIIGPLVDSGDFEFHCRDPYVAIGVKLWDERAADPQIERPGGSVWPGYIHAIKEKT